jgi:threonine dehydrogenase-like Zn-dependent dehydrogenase
MVLEEFKKPLVERKFPLPAPGPGEILVKVLAAGVCGSDVHMWQGHDPRTPLPIILGHEGVGKIVALGPCGTAALGCGCSVDGQPLRVGQKILWNRGVVCGRCYFCAVKAQPELCPNRVVYGIHRSCDKPPHLNGCYADHILLTRGTDVFLLPEDLRDRPEVAVSASCSGATAAHAVELAPISPGDSVLVQGPGPLGVYLVAFAAAAGARPIFVIGGTPERLALCKQLGATHLLNRNATSPEQRKNAIMNETSGRGVDIAFEAVGTADAVAEGVGLVRTGGTYALTGFGQPGGKLELDLYADLVRKNLRLQGVWVSHTRHTHAALAMVLKQPDRFAKLVTHKYPSRRATQALEAAMQREGMKAVLVPK